MIGSTIGNYFAQESVRDGYLGDWADSRSNELSRDQLEDDYGYSVGDTKDIMANEIDQNTYEVYADNSQDTPSNYDIKSYYEAEYQDKHEAEGPGIGGSGGGDDRQSEPGGMGGV